MTGLPQGPGKLPGPRQHWVPLLRSWPRTWPWSPAWAAECCPGQAEQWHECSILRSDLQIRTLSYSLIHANNKHWKYLHIIVMFKVEHLVISIFPLLAFSDPPWAKHYKDTPSTVQTSGIFGWLNKHEKQMGQDRNRYILVPNITKYFEN